MQNLILTTATITLLATAAFAHATLEQKEAAAGATTKITLRVPHGCDGEATHTVRITLPEGFYAAKPMPKPGWQLETVTGAYATPYNNHGTEMTEGLREVSWTGGNLEDGWYDEFTLRGTVGPNVEPGTVLYFPALQTCANGTADWTNTSDEMGADNPSPKLTVTAGGHDEHAGHGAAMTATEFTLGDLAITAAFSRATLPNAPVGGGFLTVTNTGTEDDTLVAAASPAAGHMEIHEMSMQGDVMKMRELTDGLPIPAGETVELKPGGFHLMFMQLAAPLEEGTSVDVTLTFANAGEITVPFAIGAPNAREADHSGHGMDHGAMQKDSN
ncbi:DUF1775 domain-containing protein [Algicella marina]|uniref:DUF1775 domain-containing protein n=1 Tax=Algicella marina TaxID=2683284 RepID=A0A6P1SW23_9RHOB|nr:DUF1775 domain-containing protein [Algicella marina]QHQ33850.1 DUF1775 domain-containing protein [Algicella marina]